MKLKKVELDEEEVVNESTKKKLPWYKRWYVIVMLFVLISTSIFNYNYTFVYVNGSSMEPNYEDGNIVLGEKHYDYLSRFDVVVINSDSVDNILIKRIIGLPNDTIEYVNNQLFVNGEYAVDLFGMGFTENYKIELGPDEYFCLGDNREHSWDSRLYGTFTKKEIIAKVKGRRHIKIGGVNPLYD